MNSTSRQTRTSLSSRSAGPEAPTTGPADSLRPHDGASTLSHTPLTWSSGHSTINPVSHSTATNPSACTIKPQGPASTTVARYALDAERLPSITDTLPLAEKARAILMGIYQRVKLSEILGFPIRSNDDIPPDAPRVRSNVFSGKDHGGEHLQGHRHAFFLPTDEDGDGRIDHLTLFAQMGFGKDDPVEIQTLDRFRKVWLGDDDSVRALLVGLETVDNFRGPLFRDAREWVSVTPFIATRHPKKRGRKRDAPELLADPRCFARQVLHEEIVRLMERRGLAPCGAPPDVAKPNCSPGPPQADSGDSSPDGPACRAGGAGRNPELPWRIEPLADENGAHWIRPDTWSVTACGRAFRPTEFKRFRGKPNDDGGRRPCGAFRLVFSQEVRGPLSLGQHSHFGMGLFLPAVR